MFQYKRKFAKWPWPLERHTTEKLLYPWTQLTFKGNVAHEEVRNHSIQLSSNETYTTKIENERLKTSNSYLSRATFPRFAPKTGEDFTIECKINVKSQSSLHGPILAAWLGTSNSSWLVARNTDGTITFTLALESGSTSGGISLTSSDIVPLDVDTHIAIVRNRNIVSLYVGGKAQPMTVETNQGFYPAATVSTSTGGVQWIEGDRWDVRFCRYAAYTEDFTPEPLKFFSRPLYLDSSAVLVQSLLSDSIINEIDKSEAIVNRASASYGEISFQNDNTARVGFPLSFDGLGDFTVETGYRFTNLPSSGTIHVFGFGRLNLRVNKARKLSLVAYPNWPSTSSPVEIGVSVNTLEYNQDYHIVLERVSNIISCYIDGELTFSVGYAEPVPSTELYFTTTYGSPVPTRFVWNIRAAKKAMYNGNITYNNFYPRTPFNMAISAIRYQTLVRAEFSTELSDHNIENLRYQILVKV